MKHMDIIIMNMFIIKFQYLISDLGLQETIEISEALYKYNRINMLNRESNFKGKTEATHQRISVAEIFGGGN